jgi:threonine synthase
MEAVFNDAAFKAEHKVGSINSVNICRVLVQVVHYFYAYLQLHPDADPADEVAFCIPTGAAGHITAGVMARAMGLPVRSLCAATNANDVLHRVLGSPPGVALDVSVRGSKIKVTNSPSMDIQIPYNIERMLYIATGGNTEVVRHIVRRFKAEGRLQLSAALMDSLHSLRLWSAAISNDRVCTTIAAVAGACDYVLDPHTAVGVTAALEERPPLPPPAAATGSGGGVMGAAAGGGRGAGRVWMACAHPSKVNEAKREAKRERRDAKREAKRREKRREEKRREPTLYHWDVYI